MQVGFAVVIRDEQVEFQFLGRRPEDPRSLVGHAQHGRQHAVLMGRLTYRSELVKQLPPEMVSPGLVDDDAALALAAYRRWGRSGLTRLEGCFALVVWDGDKKLLLGSRDPRGGYPLFWTKHPGGLACGTCLLPLVQLLPHRSLNLDYLAEFLSLPAGIVAEPRTEHCVYEGVHRVSPGSTIQAQAPDGQFEEQRHWNWLERMVDPGTGRLEELAELVADGLRRAVGEQLRGGVAAHVSGGMDSTTVALLARDHLRAQPGEASVHGISLVFDRLGGLSRETPYVDLALGQPGLVPHRIPADDLLDYDGFADPPLHDEPCGALFRLGLLTKSVELAAEVGAGTLLSGHGADGLIDQRPHYLADLLRSGRLLAAWRTARAWGLASNESAWTELWKYGVGPLLPAAWRRGSGRAAAVAPWIRPDFARSYSLRERALRHRAPQSRSANLSEVLSMLRVSVGDATNWYAAAPRGVTLVHPFLDPRFVCLCMGIQTRYRQEPGPQKPLLAHAMRDVLPEPIRKRRLKSHYNAMVHLGLARNLPVLEALIREAPADGPDVFDRDAMLQSLQQAALGFVPGGSLERMNLALSWLKWCSLHKEQQRPTTPAASFRVATHDRFPVACAAGCRPAGVAAGFPSNG